MHVRHVNQLLLDWPHSSSEAACVKRRMAWPQLMSPVTWGPLRHEPHQGPGERLVQRPAVQGLRVGSVQDDDPAGVVGGPGSVAAAGGDRASQGILEVTALKRRIDAGVGNYAGGTRRVISEPASGVPRRSPASLEQPGGDPGHADRRDYRGRHGESLRHPLGGHWALRPRAAYGAQRLMGHTEPDEISPARGR